MVARPSHFDSSPLRIAACFAFAVVIAGWGCGNSEPSGATSSVATSAGGGGGGGGGSTSCDNQGDCGDQNDPPTGCIACAADGACKPSVEACAASDECLAVVDCESACSDFPCIDKCAEDHPDGQALLMDFLVCLLCDQCPKDCSTDTSECP